MHSISHRPARIPGRIARVCRRLLVVSPFLMDKLCSRIATDMVMAKPADALMRRRLHSNGRLNSSHLRLNIPNAHSTLICARECC